MPTPPRPRAECARCPIGVASGAAACPFHHVVERVGTLLVVQGEVPPHAWFVKRGLVLVTSSGESGDEVSCGVRGAGTLVGLESVRGEPSPYDVWVVGELEACRIDLASFVRWVGPQDTPLGAVLSCSLAESSRRHGERTAIAGRSEVRLARFLLAREQAGARGATLPLQLQQLARMLAMRPETLSRAVARLRSAGAIGEARGVRVVDVARLAAVAEVSQGGA